ncbi:hypothetical protein BHE74_00031794, partial [Ensete ventricosum]
MAHGRGPRAGASGKSRTARYIPVQQLTGTWTGRYRAVPLRSAVGCRFRLSTIDLCQEEEKKKKKKKKKKRRRSTSCHPSGDSARGSPALPEHRRRPHCPSAVAACGCFFSPRGREFEA